MGAGGPAAANFEKNAPAMHEKFLQYLWRWRRFDGQNLRTTDGQHLEILHPGEPNDHAGPDFLNARIRLNETLWAGAVEIHVRASEWLAHRHDTDRSYDNVVLHVVFEPDQIIRRSSGESLPCLSLQGRIPPKLLEHYLRLEHERAWIPCAWFIPQVPSIVLNNWLDRLLVERLEQKTAQVAAWLTETGHHWEAAFYRALARNYGLKVNTDPFEALARSLPLPVLVRQRGSLFQLEALMFGQAGFLETTFEDEYPRALAREYAHLRRKYCLTPLQASIWKFLRMRPGNFPTLRLAQFAALWQQSGALFGQILDGQQLRDWEQLFAVPVSEYWHTHYLFDKPSATQTHHPGAGFIHSLLINTVAPFLFHYGKIRFQPAYQEKAVQLLEQLPPEDNAVLRGWQQLGIQANDALQSQALLQLKTRYCDQKRCLECAVFGTL